MNQTTFSGDSRRARFLMIGGFLGAGKSTALGRLARSLRDDGLRVGLITNDQGSGLVDTRNLRHQGFAVEEIAGGCFCCRFDSLRSAAAELEASERPEVFVAEPVGSCTDLLATVSYPLRRLYGESFDIAPLSVMVDPRRAARVLGLDSGRRFSDKVTYVYRKQLDEAQVIVINKIDAVDSAFRSDLRGALSERYPGARIFEVSARETDGLDAWFRYIRTESLGHHPVLDIDYDVYAEGEALLGWLNATVHLEAPDDVDGNDLVDDVARSLLTRLRRGDVEIAHLKMTLSPTSGGAFSDDLALVNLVGTEWVPEVSERLRAPLKRGDLVVNLRAEATPDTLEQSLAQEIADRPHLSLTHVESFAPAPPEPTHRMTSQPTDLDVTPTVG
ncbi:MAG: cobalamin biosynthesis protein P47K [Thermoanaerobaculia bacterium]|nr:cobalamin biosynthesis protein P47K [Thermoanaerobaculia bacterium]